MSIEHMCAAHINSNLKKQQKNHTQKADERTMERTNEQKKFETKSEQMTVWAI